MGGRRWVRFHYRRREVRPNMLRDLAAGDNVRGLEVAFGR